MSAQDLVGMTVDDDGLRTAARKALALFDHEVPYVGGERQQAFERVAGELRRALWVDRQVTALSGALSAVGDDLGEALRKSEIYRQGLAEAVVRANTAEAQRDQAWRNLDTAHEDIAALLRESGLGDHARSVSTHDVIRDELLPWVRRAARALRVSA